MSRPPRADADFVKKRADDSPVVAEATAPCMGAAGPAAHVASFGRTLPNSAAAAAKDALAAPKAESSLRSVFDELALKLPI